MTKTFWHSLKTQWYNKYTATYKSWCPVTCNYTIFDKLLESGAEREVFIKEQNSIIRQCKNDSEYIDLFKIINTLSD